MPASLLPRTLCSTLLACGLLASLCSPLPSAAADAASPAVVAAPAASSASDAETQGIETVDYNPDDPDIQAAVQAARKTLPAFFRVFAKPSPMISAVAVKVEVRQDKLREYIWVTPFEVDGQGYKGTVNDIPHKVLRVKTGEVIHFVRNDIVDWAYIDLHARRLHGNYTTCAMLRRGPASDMAELKRTYGLDCDHP